MKGDDILVGLDTPTVPSRSDRPKVRYVRDLEVRSHVAALLGLILVAAALFALCLRSAPRSLPPDELIFLGLAMTAGAMGGLIHAATSFATFAGNRELLRSWLPWFYLRAPIAMLLAALTYLAARA